MNSLFGFGRPLFRLGRDSGLAFGLLHSDDFASRHRGGLSAADVARRRSLNWLRDRHCWRRTRCLILRRHALALLPEANAKSDGRADRDGHADADRDGPIRASPGQARNRRCPARWPLARRPLRVAALPRLVCRRGGRAAASSPCGLPCVLRGPELRC